MIHRCISLPIFDGAVNVLFTDSSTTGAHWLAKKFPKEPIDPYDWGDAAAFVWTVQRWPWVVLPWDASIDTISHEAVHAAYEYNNALGVKCGYSNQESLAYLVGWLTARFANMLADINLERAKHLATLRATERRFADEIAKVRAPSATEARAEKRPRKR